MAKPISRSETKDTPTKMSTRLKGHKVRAYAHVQRVVQKLLSRCRNMTAIYDVMYEEGEGRFGMKRPHHCFRETNRTWGKISIFSNDTHMEERIGRCTILDLLKGSLAFCIRAYESAQKVYLDGICASTRRCIDRDPNGNGLLCGFPGHFRVGDDYRCDRCQIRLNGKHALQMLKIMHGKKRKRGVL